jgi:hypothetical protein
MFVRSSTCFNERTPGRILMQTCLWDPPHTFHLPALCNSEVEVERTSEVIAPLVISNGHCNGRE